MPRGYQRVGIPLAVEMVFFNKKPLPGFVGARNGERPLAERGSIEREGPGGAQRRGMKQPSQPARGQLHFYETTAFFSRRERVPSLLPNKYTHKTKQQFNR